MDVNDSAIEQSFGDYAAPLLIHGHTHRPATQIYGAHDTRIVLPDWRPDQLFYLRCDAIPDAEHHEPVFRLESLA
jgi:UDP-2,3-diacylglucosamine hydrolase